MHRSIVKPFNYAHKCTICMICLSHSPGMICPLSPGISSQNRVLNTLSSLFFFQNNGSEPEHLYTCFFFVTRYSGRLALWTTLALRLWQRRPRVRQLGQWQPSLQLESSIVFWQISLRSAISMIGLVEIRMLNCVSSFRSPRLSCLSSQNKRYSDFAGSSYPDMLKRLNSFLSFGLRSRKHLLCHWRVQWCRQSRGCDPGLRHRDGRP